MRSLPFYLLATCLVGTTVSAQTTTKVLFIGKAAAWAGNSGDKPLLAFLQKRYGAANVTYQDTEPAGSVKAETLLGYDVVVLSATPDSPRYRNIVHNSPAPVVNMEEAIADNGAGEFSITSGRTKETEVDLSVVIDPAYANHPIVKGLTSPIKLMTGPLPGQEVWWSTGTQAAGAFSICADDDTATNLFVTCIEAGGTLLNNQTAPCRRVMFGLTDRSFMSFTPEGEQLLGQAIDWAAAECCAQSSTYGTGLAGTNGIPTIDLTAPPVYGTNTTLIASNSYGVATSGLVIVGTTPTSVPFLSGTILANTSLLTFLPIPATGLSLPIPVPNLGPVCGPAPFSHLFYVQVLQVDPAATSGVSFTPGLRLEIGK